MTTEQKIEVIKEVADVIGGDFTDTYSGRGMYGQECCGVTCDDADHAIEEAAERGLKGSRTDNMGKGYIVYWERVQAKATA